MRSTKKAHYVLALVLGVFIAMVPAYGQVNDEQVHEREVNPQPIQVPIENSPTTGAEEQHSRAARSFSNTIAWNDQNRFGVSLSATVGRISNVFQSAGERTPATLAAFSGGVFTNFGRHKSRLHLDYNAGYRNYYGQGGSKGSDHYGNITYSYQASRKVRFQARDIISSSLNDPFSNFAPILRTDINWNPNPAYEVIFQPQRVTVNRVNGSVDLDLTRGTHIYGYGSYDSYWYEKEIFDKINGVQMGGGLDQRITSWLYLSSSYSAYLNDIDARLRNQQIHRLEIGRFRFRPSRYSEIFFSGGIEVAHEPSGYRTRGMFRAGVSRSSEKNALYANYQRTMTSALGYARILRSDVVTLGWGQRFTPRTSLRLTGSYLRGADFHESGSLRGYWARAQLEYALRSDLFASINSGYQYQKNSIPGFADVPHFDRSVVFATLQYVWPSIRLRTE